MYVNYIFPQKLNKLNWSEPPRNGSTREVTEWHPGDYLYVIGSAASNDLEHVLTVHLGSDIQNEKKNNQRGTYDDIM